MSNDVRHQTNIIRHVNPATVIDEASHNHVGDGLPATNPSATAQGIGQATLERVVVDPDGQPLAASFMDYAMPRADDLPFFDVAYLPTRCTTNPLGVKGAAEAAVVGSTDDLTGQAIVGYVILRGGNEPSQELGNEIREHVGVKLGKIARPKTVIIVPDLPKTRSGKIMRRLLRDVADGRQLGDTTTLADPGVVAEIAERASDGGDDD